MTFDLAGSLTGLVPLLDQLPKGLRIGYDNLPNVWDDVPQLGQTWTPDLQQQAFEFNVPVYNIAAVQKRKYSTDINSLNSAIEWGNDFLSNDVSGDYAVDDVYDFLIDDYNNYITT